MIIFEIFEKGKILKFSKNHGISDDHKDSEEFFIIKPAYMKVGINKKYVKKEWNRSWEIFRYNHTKWVIEIKYFLGGDVRQTLLLLQFLT